MWYPLTIREVLSMFWGMIWTPRMVSPKDEAFVMHKDAAVQNIESMLLTREGEVITKELARERARNIVSALLDTEIRG